MSQQSLYVGSAPSGESCAQVGREEYHLHARRECQALIGQLRRVFGPEPPGCRLFIKSNPHDFGSYLTVECGYSPEDPLAVEYAFRCDAELPEEWDEEARRALGLDHSSNDPSRDTGGREGQ